MDFEKAFESLDRSTTWRLTEHNGMPSTFISIIRNLYDDAVCHIIHHGKLTHSLTVKTGVLQYCIISPTIFLIVIDWIMKETTQNNNIPSPNTLRTWIFQMTLNCYNINNNMRKRNWRVLQQKQKKNGPKKHKKRRRWWGWITKECIKPVKWRGYQINR